MAAGAFVLFGHALVSQERWLSIPADIVHVVFAAMWAGGLVGLVTVLRSRTRAARLAGQLPSSAVPFVMTAESPRPTRAALATRAVAGGRRPHSWSGRHSLQIRHRIALAGPPHLAALAATEATVSEEAGTMTAVS